ncbi:MAG: outer membrane beta-barrel protein [Prevotellaceae bacterium]|nr:outer membrane beta-barrel protein [Candidatus Colivivens caballi]
MKKIILSALVAVCAMTVNAQVWVGGSLGFDVKDYEGSDESQSTISLKPEVGYTLNDNWDVAVALGFTSISNAGGVKDKNLTEFTINPYARYTFAKAGIASFFVDGGISYGSVKPKGGDAQSTFTILVRPGVKVALSEKIGLVSHLGSLGYKTVEDSYNEFGLGVDNMVDFGIYFGL